MRGRRDSLPTLFHRPFVAQHHRLDSPESRYVEYVQCSSQFVDKYPVHADFCRRSRPPVPGRRDRRGSPVNKPYGWHQCPGHVRGRFAGRWSVSPDAAISASNAHQQSNSPDRLNRLRHTRGSDYPVPVRAACFPCRNDAVYRQHRPEPVSTS